MSWALDQNCLLLPIPALTDLADCLCGVAESRSTRLTSSKQLPQSYLLKRAEIV